MCTLYCLFRLFSNPGPGSEPGGQSHSGLEAEGRLKGGGGGAPHKIQFSRCPNCAEALLGTEDVHRVFAAVTAETGFGAGFFSTNGSPGL